MVGTYADYSYNDDPTNLPTTSCNIEKLVMANYNLTAIGNQESTQLN